MLSLKNSLDLSTDVLLNARNKAKDSIDRKIAREMARLEDEYELNKAKIVEEANKTMDRKLRKEWRQAQKTYFDYMNKVLSELDNP